MITTAAIPARYNVSSAAYPPSLHDVIAFNNEQLIPHINRMRGMLRQGRRYQQDVLQFRTAARAIARLTRLIMRFGPPIGNGHAINELYNEAELLHTLVDQTFRHYATLETSHPSYWRRRRRLVTRANQLLDFRHGRHNRLARFKDFFGRTDAASRSIQRQIKPYLAQNFCALHETLASTSGAQALVNRSAAALNSWQNNSLTVAGASNSFELFLAWANIVGSVGGNMPDVGDSFAVGLLRLHIYRALGEASRGRTASFNRLTTQIVRAANMPNNGTDYVQRVQRLLWVRDGNRWISNEQQARNFAQVQGLIEPHFQTGFGLSLFQTSLNGLQLLGAIAAFDRDPNDRELQDYVNLGTAAYFTGVDLVVTLTRVAPVSVRTAALELALGRQTIARLSRVNTIALTITGAYGVGAGLRELRDGYREGDGMQMASGGLGAVASAAMTYAAVAELFALAGASAASGVGIVVGAAAAVVALAMVYREHGRQQQAQREAAREARRSRTGAALRGLVGVMLSGLRSRSEVNPEAAAHDRRERNRRDPNYMGGRFPAPPRPFRGDRHGALVDVVDREANVRIRQKLERIAVLLQPRNIIFNPLQPRNATERRQMFDALRSLGFDPNRRETRDMVTSA